MRSNPPETSALGVTPSNPRERVLAVLLNGLPGRIMILAGLLPAGVSLFADTLEIGGPAVGAAIRIDLGRVRHPGAMRETAAATMKAM